MRDRWHRILYQNGAILKGHFLLSAGRHSDTYVQCARILQFPWYAEELGQGLGEAIRAQGTPDVIISPALGAILIGYEVARALQTPFLFTERVGDQMALRRDQRIEAGRAYWIVEDVITTGRSTHEVAAIVHQGGGTVVGCAAIVDRSVPEVTFPWPKVSLLRMEIPLFDPDACPLCQAQVPLQAPGSRHGPTPGSPP
jgi:orotate phosphoribosyltransferase